MAAKRKARNTKKVIRRSSSQKELIPGFDNILMLAFAVSGLAAIFIIILLALMTS